jgi:hypothetical protein
MEVAKASDIGNGILVSCHPAGSLIVRTQLHHPERDTGIGTQHPAGIRSPNQGISIIDRFFLRQKWMKANYKGAESDDQAYMHFTVPNFFTDSIGNPRTLHRKKGGISSW